ncbi:MAG: hypothetical protein COW73_06195 [Nitrospirae bacterium CG18_big_fil_WC_8_21_14_2_50_70_55]|nr:hypothetical protein [Deltaproteobacteria bacterium]OIP62998.1 MAG: hypothetical protein AUK30_09125 [Nitrospirae bacterium CG2_30_70_394]PIQ05328.1 MAG: hypothetical protein COW73_06195 [Nitrospirae bacterium CG18_big_fil_WC_8_21_14_2_50_70_55]PIU79651.1 MAG: hypothetical protein COS73_03385 [Nitrospirae bacterium CG06_land_8_20_14_3_00_70_43]PIX83148.1 MAG: hypothetical protein COZ33_06920 [Nitrospirae bacterium CG_4_10_14_3_um_filter_70_108]PJB95624.1 MAG: hypothetical protein CO080_0663
MERRNRWVERVLDAYGSGVELLGHTTDRLSRLARQVVPEERARLQRLEHEAHRLIEAHTGQAGDRLRPAVRALHHEVALLEAAVVARRFRHLARTGAYEQAGETLLAIDETVEQAAAALGDDHPEVELARRALRTLLDTLHEELRVSRDGATWLMACIGRFREEGTTAVWPPYPGTEESVAEEDVDGM